jgi:hypothetical protein
MGALDEGALIQPPSATASDDANAAASTAKRRWIRGNVFMVCSSESAGMEAARKEVVDRNVHQAGVGAIKKAFDQPDQKTR